MSKVKVLFPGFSEMQDKLRRMGADLEQVAVDALKATNDYVYKGALQAIQKANLPAGGKYSRGKTEAALRRDPIIVKDGSEISAHVGFDIKKGGLVSIFLMYGTPKYPKVQELYDIFWGESAPIWAVQREVYEKAMEKYHG